MDSALAQAPQHMECLELGGRKHLSLEACNRYPFVERSEKRDHEAKRRRETHHVTPFIPRLLCYYRAFHGLPYLPAGCGSTGISPTRAALLQGSSVQLSVLQRSSVMTCCSIYLLNLLLFCVVPVVVHLP